MSGWRVEGYTEVRELGAGAQGRVVLARHEPSGTPVAIKYLNASASEAERERLRHDARMLGRAESPHVARLFHLVEGPDGAAIIMEAVDGVSLKELLARARTGRMRGSELGDATITVTDLGDQGVESVTGVIFPPQVALLGFGKIVERPWAVDGLLGVRPVVTATLAADHRASDGRTGARLLAAVDRLLQHPEEL